LSPKEKLIISAYIPIRRGRKKEMGERDAYTTEQMIFEVEGDIITALLNHPKDLA
jgi:hypothetical protein